MRSCADSACASSHRAPNGSSSTPSTVHSGCGRCSAMPMRCRWPMRGRGPHRCSPPSGALSLRPGAGRHHSPAAPHRMPQERNPHASLVGGAPRRPRTRRCEDRAAHGAAQREGPGHPRTTAPGREPLRVPLPARRHPSTEFRPPAVEHRAPRGRPRGRASPRPAPHGRKCRGDARCPGARRLAAARSRQSTNDVRYAHLADRDIEAAAERVGAELARVMALR